MTAVNPPGPTAYAVSPAINPTTGAQVVDPNDLIVPSIASPNLPSAPQSGPGVSGSGGYTASQMQVLSAILAELRVISTLLQLDCAMQRDLSALRADEAGGATGAVVN